MFNFNLILEDKHILTSILTSILEIHWLVIIQQFTKPMKLRGLHTPALVLWSVIGRLDEAVLKRQPEWDRLDTSLTTGVKDSDEVQNKTSLNIKAEPMKRLNLCI